MGSIVIKLGRLIYKDIILIGVKFHGNPLSNNDVKLAQSERKNLSRLLGLLRLQGIC